MPIRVLVADDAADLRGLLRLVLDIEDDFEVVGEASDGAEAISMARAAQPDLIVLDIAMPMMDGLTALPRLRTAAPDAKIVMFSAYDAASMVERAHAGGASAYIDKASGVVDLVGRLRGICQPV